MFKFDYFTPLTLKMLFLNNAHSLILNITKHYQICFLMTNDVCLAVEGQFEVPLEVI